MTQLEALKEIARRNGGVVTPAEVVDAAVPEESPLHGAFEWDDGKAAKEYRIIQAQRLIRSFRVEIDDDGRKVETPVFIGLSTDRTNGKADNCYRLAVDVAKSPELMAVAVNDALDELEGVRNRYNHLKELADVWSAIDKHGLKRKG